ncbi:hypothetical protein EDD16DRAFT_1641839 [Pisolithus croceorrhizus]|nr:hypothetical protein EDD16DRAFT_1641839 [Pisolithus croceorrhizus]
MDEAYSMSPVRASPRQLLESPPRQPPAVCKTPYRVLDAPDLADDFHLNLVDWSTTNILGVGPGAHVYLWTAYNAAVAKLCDLSNVGDTMSSVAWVQKGTIPAVGALSGRLHIYDAPFYPSYDLTIQPTPSALVPYRGMPMYSVQRYMISCSTTLFETPTNRIRHTRTQSQIAFPLLSLITGGCPSCRKSTRTRLNTFTPPMHRTQRMIIGKKMLRL